MRIIVKKRTLFLLFLGIFLIQCSRDFMPKPEGYNRIELPDHSYYHLPDTLPYNFEISRLARLNTDTSWIYMKMIQEKIDPGKDIQDERYWIDLIYDTLGADIEITYKPIFGEDNLVKEYFGDANKLTWQHQIKAYSIEETILKTQNGLTATLAEISGEVPTPLQFVTTDSQKHFLRGALYFKIASKNDSLAPVIEYIKRDILHLLNTLEWKNN